MEKNLNIENLEKIVIMLYQNHEKNGLENISELLSTLQEIIGRIPKNNQEESSAFVIEMLNELVKAYNMKDMIGLADCVKQKVTMFMQYYSLLEEKGKII